MTKPRDNAAKLCFEATGLASNAIIGRGRNRRMRSMMSAIIRPLHVFSGPCLMLN